MSQRRKILGDLHLDSLVKLFNAKEKENNESSKIKVLITERERQDGGASGVWGPGLASLAGFKEFFCNQF